MFGLSTSGTPKAEVAGSGTMGWLCNGSTPLLRPIRVLLYFLDSSSQTGCRQDFSRICLRIGQFVPQGKEFFDATERCCSNPMGWIKGDSAARRSEKCRLQSIPSVWRV